MWRWASVAFVCALLSATCRPSVGTFGQIAYRHPEYPYSVLYQDSSQKTLMSGDWQLDNFYKVGRQLKRKTGADYESTLYVDVDSDGKSDEIGVVPDFDLRFTHKRSSAVVWLRTTPMALSAKEKDLRVIMDGIVESISGGGYRVIELEGKLHTSNSEQRYAAKVVRTSEAKLAKREAHVTVVDVSNVDRLKVDPNSVEARMMIVLVRTGIEVKLRRMVKDQFPVIMIGGYAAAPADFDASLADFEAFLARVEIGGAIGFQENEQTAAPVPVDAGVTDVGIEDVASASREDAEAIDLDAGTTLAD